MSQSMFAGRTLRLGNNFVMNGDQVLGQGAFGCVYGGYQDTPEEKRSVAIKIFSRRDSFQSSAAEIKAMENLKHPNLVEMISSGQADILPGGQQSVFIIYELCNQGNLEEYLERCGEALTISQIMDIYRQIIDAFRYLQAQGLVHRDVKTENILLNNDVPKVSDFGCAQKVNSIGGTSAGTPLYRDVYFSQNDEWHPKSDIFSLGILLYHMIYYVKGNQERSFPWFGRNEYQLSKNMMEKQPEFRDRRGLLPEIKELMQQMLETDPNKRISWDALFRHKLLETKAIDPSINSHKDFMISHIQIKSFAHAEVNELSATQRQVVNQQQIQLKEQEERIKRGRTHYERMLHCFRVGQFLVKTLDLYNKCSAHISLNGTAQDYYTKYFLSLRALLIFEELHVLLPGGKLIDSYAKYAQTLKGRRLGLANDFEFDELKAYLENQRKSREIEYLSKVSETNYNEINQTLVPAYQASRRLSGDKQTFSGSKQIDEQKQQEYLKKTVRVLGKQLVMLHDSVNAAMISPIVNDQLVLIENLLLVYQFREALEWDPVKSRMRCVESMQYQRKNVPLQQLFLRIFKAYETLKLI